LRSTKANKLLYNCSVPPCREKGEGDLAKWLTVPAVK
jgi:hypothetical protein